METYLLDFLSNNHDKVFCTKMGSLSCQRCYLSLALC